MLLRAVPDICDDRSGLHADSLSDHSGTGRESHGALRIHGRWLNTLYSVCLWKQDERQRQLTRTTILCHASSRSQLAYPALVFWTLASLNFSEMMWPFFWSTLVTRTLILLLPACVQLLRHGTSPDSVADAGMYGIFTSQSNDMVLAVPILQAMFQDTHPNWYQMLYVITLSRVILNPFGST